MLLLWFASSAALSWRQIIELPAAGSSCGRCGKCLTRRYPVEGVRRWGSWGCQGKSHVYLTFTTTEYLSVNHCLCGFPSLYCVRFLCVAAISSMHVRMRATKKATTLASSAAGSNASQRKQKNQHAIANKQQK